MTTTNIASYFKGFLNSFTLERTENRNISAKKATIITKECVIDGSIRCESGLIIDGVVNGDIVCAGNVKINGTVNGNILGQNVEVNNAQVVGNVTANDFIIVGGGECSSIEGFLKAQQADINGAIKGNITVSQSLILQQNATVGGDIQTASITITQHAVFNGNITIVR